jgi:hypothetical protein
VSRLDPQLAAALLVLERTLGPVQLLDVHPTAAPQPRLASPPAPPQPARAGACPGQLSLYDPAAGPEPDSCPSDLEVMP